MMHHLKITLLLSCIAAHANASQAQQVPRSYQGIVINEANLTELAPKTPHDIHQKTQAWLKANPQVADTALGYESFIPTAEITLEDGSKRKTIKPLLDATNAMLEQQGTKNVSPFNYVFQHPADKNWMVKIAGHVNRKYNVSHMAQALKMDGAIWDANNVAKTGYDYNYVLSQQDYERFIKERSEHEFDKIIKGNGQVEPVLTAPKTFQTISRIAHNLLLLEAIEQKKVSLITAPAMYLEHIPGRPAEVSDRNYIVVEQRLEGLKEIDTLTPEQEEELETAIRLTGLFNINRENCKLTQNGKIAILDFEQPNNSLPTDFFHKSPQRFQNNLQAGLNSFGEMKEKIAAEQNTKFGKLLNSLALKNKPNLDK